MSDNGMPAGADDASMAGKNEEGQRPTKSSLANAIAADGDTEDKDKDEPGGGPGTESGADENQYPTPDETQELGPAAPGGLPE
jgi:hypothetical protein